MAAVKLLNRLAGKLGRELCEQFVAYEMMCMADDPEQKVRKTTMQNFVKVCETVDSEFFMRKLLPFYQKYQSVLFFLNRLAKDPFFPVREAAANVLVNISNICALDKRETVLVDLFNDFYKDPARSVKKVSLLQLGHFLYSLKGSKINPFLVQLYASLDPKLTVDQELIYHCAYTFPAVLLSLGAAEWPSLKNVYKNLIKQDLPQVKATLAASIHEVAKIVGGKVAAEELDPILKNFLNDPTTAHMCFAHLHEFLLVLEDKQRLAYLDLVDKIIIKSQHNWRLREVFAESAEEYAKMFDIHTVHDRIAKLLYGLLQDNVIEVRMKMCKHIQAIVTGFAAETAYFDEAINFVLKLFESSNFRDRQTFIYICEGFMCNESFFDQYFMTQFLTLQKDRVISVRVSLAKILHAHMKSSGVLAKNVHILRTIQLLQTDPAKEVKECVLAASIECDKMKEIESEKMREIERAQEAASVHVDISTVDEEEVAEVQRKKAEQFVKQTIKIDEIEEKVGKMASGIAKQKPVPS